MRLATNEVWNDAQGQKQERTSWHSVAVWEKGAAKACADRLQKGSLVQVEGRLNYRETKHSKYPDVTLTYVSVIATEVRFLADLRRRPEPPPER